MVFGCVLDWDFNKKLVLVSLNPELVAERKAVETHKGKQKKVHYRSTEVVITKGGNIILCSISLNMQHSKYPVRYSYIVSSGLQRSDVLRACISCQKHCSLTSQVSEILTVKPKVNAVTEELSFVAAHVKEFNNCCPPSLSAHNFVSHSSSCATVFIQTCYKFSLQTPAKFEAMKTEVALDFWV